MQRLLMMSVLAMIACGPPAAHGPSTSTTVTTTTGDDVVCTDERSPTSQMTHRVCRRRLATSAETGEKDMICADEVATGTNVSRRVCRTQVEKDHDKKLAQDAWLHQASRVGCNPETMTCEKGPGL